MLRAILLGALLVVPACSKGAGGGSGPAVVAGAQVGTVLELTGKVTATRDGAARELRVGDAVSGDDVIATSAEANVAIELAHNNARWNLGANKSSRVSESSAWTLARAAKPAEGVGGDTSAAGRHAERNSADTASTVERKTEPAPAEAVATDPTTPTPEAAGMAAPKPGGTAPKPDRGPRPAKDATRSPKSELPADDAGDMGDVLGSSEGVVVGGAGGIRGGGEGGGGGGVGTSGIGSIGKGGGTGTGYGAGASGGKRSPAPGGAESPETTPTPTAPQAPPPPPPPPPPPANTTYEQAEQMIRGSASIKTCMGTLAETHLAVKCDGVTCKVIDSKLDAKGKLCVEAAINKLGILGELVVKTRITK